MEGKPVVAGSESGNADCIRRVSEPVGHAALPGFRKRTTELVSVVRFVRFKCVKTIAYRT